MEGLWLTSSMLRSPLLTHCLLLVFPYFIDADTFDDMDCFFGNEQLLQINKAEVNAHVCSQLICGAPDTITY